MVRVTSSIRTRYKKVTRTSGYPLGDINLMCVEPMMAGQEQEALGFLELNSIDNAILSGLIRDNGLHSRLNRGVFYGCRDRKGQLQGIALIGHVTLFDAHNQSAVIALARTAGKDSSIFSIAGEYKRLEEFWRHYTNGENRPHRRISELMMEQRFPGLIATDPIDLRLATIDDLDLVVEAHAKLTEEEIGIKPLDLDPVGFRDRCKHRILQNRVWVWIEEKKLRFKIDVISDIPNVVYLEGLYVDTEERRKGIGSRCFSRLSYILLSRMKAGAAIAVLVNEQHYHAQAFYAKMGFKLHSCYQRITLQK